MIDFAPRPPPLPPGTPPQLMEFYAHAMETAAVLRENGAVQAATAREATISEFREHLASWLNDFVSVKEAAEILGCCEETIRRWIRDGDLKSHQSGDRGHHKIRRGDLLRLDRNGRDAYDPDTDAQDDAALGGPR